MQMLGLSQPQQGNTNDLSQYLNGRLNPGQTGFGSQSFGGQQGFTQTAQPSVQDTLLSQLQGQAPTGTSPDPRSLFSNIQTGGYQDIINRLPASGNINSNIDFLRNQGANPISVNNPVLDQISQSALNRTSSPILDELYQSAQGTQGLEQINPVLSSLRDQGFTDIMNKAASRGKAYSGGTLEDLTRFNSDLSAQLVPQLQQQQFNNLLGTYGAQSQDQQQGFNQLLGASGVQSQDRAQGFNELLGGFGAQSQQNQQGFGNLLNALNAGNQQQNMNFGQTLDLVGTGANLNQQQFGQDLTRLGTEADLLGNQFNQGLGLFGAGSDLRNNELNQLMSILGTGSDLQNQQFSQLFNVLGLGANAATGQGSAALSTANNIGSLLTNRGQAQGDRYINQANATNDFLGNLFGIYGAYNSGAFG
jgi:hypothetical protein